MNETLDQTDDLDHDEAVVQYDQQPIPPFFDWTAPIVFAVLGVIMFGIYALIDNFPGFWGQVLLGAKGGAVVGILLGVRQPIQLYFVFQSFVVAGLLAAVAFHETWLARFAVLTLFPASQYLIYVLAGKGSGLRKLGWGAAPIYTGIIGLMIGLFVGVAQSRVELRAFLLSVGMSVTIGAVAGILLALISYPVRRYLPAESANRAVTARVFPRRGILLLGIIVGVLFGGFDWYKERSIESAVRAAMISGACGCLLGLGFRSDDLKRRRKSDNPDENQDD